MSAPVHARGILVRRRRFQDTSLVLTWITAERGVCKTLAKGVLRPGGNRGGAPDLYYACDFTFILRPAVELGRLTEWQLVQPHLGLRRSLVQVQTAQYFAELVLALEQPDSPLPEACALYARALDWLESRDCSARLVERFERRLAEAAGFGGNLDAALRHYHHPVPPLRAEILRCLETKKKPEKSRLEF